MSAAVISIVPEIRIKKILFAIDFSDASTKALPIVSNLARKYASHVYLAHIWMPLPYTMVTPENVTELESRQEREVREKIGELASASEMDGVASSVLAKSGLPVEELNKMIADYQIDLVVLGTHGRSGIQRFLMGSVSEGLFRHLSCPVLTVGPHVTSRFETLDTVRNILLPTDLSEESEAVVPYVASLAAEYNAKITFLHVLPLEAGVNPDAVQLAEPLREQMERKFSPQISPRSRPDFLLDFGDATESILSHARNIDADLIGLGVRQAAEITTHFQKTVAYKVVVGAECPVLTVRK